MTDPDETDGSTSWKPWFYGVMAVLGLAGAGLIGYTVASPGGTTGSAMSSPGSRAAPADGGGEEGQRQFPARFDTLGVAKGAEDASLVIREFADYQCPACRSFYPTMQKIEKEYVESGRVRYVFFDFPLTSQHPNAMAAAQAARCAGEQGAYWVMHEALFENQREWSGLDDPLPAFRDYARGIGIDPARLASCVESGEKRDEVERSREFARALGVSSTPTLVVGNTGIRGAASWSRIRQLIEQKLADAEGGASGAGAPRSAPASQAAPPAR